MGTFRPWKLVGLEEGSWRRAARLWALLFCLTAAFELARGNVIAVYLERLGGRDLAFVIVLEGALRLVAACLYFLLVKRLSYSRLMWLTGAVYGAAVALLMLSLDSGSTGGLRLFFALERVAFNLVTLHWGVYLVDFFTVREASSAFPFVHSAEPLAAVPAGLLLVLVPSSASPTLLLLVPLALVAAALLLTAWTSRLLAESPRVPVHRFEDEDGRFDPAPWRYVLTAPIVKYMALASAVLIFVRADLEVTYGQVLSDMYDTAGGIRKFWGWYVLASNAVVFVLQFLFSARLTRAAAPTRVNLSYSVAVLLSFGGLLVLPGTPMVVLSKFVREELKSILKTPFSAMIYGAMADYARPHARVAVFGGVMPVASMASGLLLMSVSGPGTSPVWFAAPGLVGGAVFVAVTVLQNRAYKLALIDMMAAKLGLQTYSGLASSLMPSPDGRHAQIAALRKRADYLLVRYRSARSLFPGLFLPSPPRVVGLEPGEHSRPSFRIAEMEDFLLAVELYRPKGAPYLRGFLVTALRDRRVDLRDTAVEVISSILPARLAARCRALLSEGLEHGLDQG